MPAATEQPALKKEREELLWQSLKEHIMRERQKLKEGKLRVLVVFFAPGPFCGRCGVRWPAAGRIS